MMKLLKWSLGAGAALAGLFLLFPSYISTAVGLATSSIKNQVPIEFEIERARGLLRGIEPQIESCKREVASSQVAAEELQTEVGRLREYVVARTDRLKANKALLANPVAAVAASSTTEMVVPRERVAINVKRELDVLKNDTARLESKEKLLERQQAAVAARHERLLAVRSEKERLEDLVENLLTQQQHVQALAAQSPNLQLDDSALGEAKRVLADIKQRLDVTQKVLENDMVFDIGSTPEPVSAAEVLVELEEFLAGAAPSAR